MQIFKSKSLASFRNFFNDEIQLSGDWRVALSETIFPTKIENVVEGEFIAFSLKEYEEATKKAAEANVISRPYNGSKLGFIPGKFDNINQLLALIKRTVGLPHFSFSEIRNSGKYEVLFEKHEGITFLSKEIPSILGFKAVPDGNGIHIGYKINSTADKLMKSDEMKAYFGELPADLLAGKHLIFVYANIIEYQYVVDAKAPLLRVIDSKQRLKNGSVCELEPTHGINFSNLVYKKLLTNTIQSLSIELRTETGDLVPFSGTGKVLLTLQFKVFKLKWIHITQIKQLLCRIFLDTNFYRQRDSGFGALAAGIGRVALPLARRFILECSRATGRSKQ